MQRRDCNSHLADMLNPFNNASILFIAREFFEKRNSLFILPKMNNANIN